MSDFYQVVTPENVEIDYELAGIGSRFLAVLVDIFIQSVFSFGLLYGLSLLNIEDLSLDADIKELSHSFAAAVILALIALIWLGYYVILEAGFNGQTFGKRLLNIRVRKEQGYAPSFWDILIRNMIRPIDFFPSFYVIGFFTMFLNKKSKRLGDFAAGTIVVKEIPRKKIKNFLNTVAASTTDVPRKQFEEDERPWMNRLLLQLTAADYLFLQNLYNRRNHLTNYNVLIITALHKISEAKLPGEPCTVPFTEAPAVLEELLQLYEQTYYNR